MTTLELFLVSLVANVATLILMALGVLLVAYVDGRRKQKQLQELIERSTPHEHNH